MRIRNAPPGTIRAALRYPAFRWLLSALRAHPVALRLVGAFVLANALVVLRRIRAVPGTAQPAVVGDATAR